MTFVPANLLLADYMIDSLVDLAAEAVTWLTERLASNVGRRVDRYRRRSERLGQSGWQDVIGLDDVYVGSFWRHVAGQRLDGFVDTLWDTLSLHVTAVDLTLREAIVATDALRETWRREFTALVVRAAIDAIEDELQAGRRPGAVSERLNLEARLIARLQRPLLAPEQIRASVVVAAERAAALAARRR